MHFYPCHKSLFAFCGLDWSDEENNDSASDDNSIILVNNWWTPKRDILLNAKIARGLPSVDCTTLPSLSKDTKETLTNLGRIKRDTIECVFNEDEKNKIAEVTAAGNQLLETTYSRNNIMELMSYPFDLREKKSSLGEHNIPRKKTISSVIKKLGYKHLPKEGFSGMLVYGKTTENNNRMVIEFDSGKWFYDLSCNVILEGPGWKYDYSHIPCVENSLGDTFPISDVETIEKVVTNFCVVIDYLENNCFKELDELHGPAPKWYLY